MLKVKFWCIDLWSLKFSKVRSNVVTPQMYRGTEDGGVGRDVWTRLLSPAHPPGISHRTRKREGERTVSLLDYSVKGEATARGEAARPCRTFSRSREGGDRNLRNPSPSSRELIIICTFVKVEGERKIMAINLESMPFATLRRTAFLFRSQTRTDRLSLMSGPKV